MVFSLPYLRTVRADQTICGSHHTPTERDAAQRPGGVADQEYLPDALRGTVFYRPGPYGREKQIAERMEWWNARRGKPGSPPEQA